MSNNSQTQKEAGAREMLIKHISNHLGISVEEAMANGDNEKAENDLQPFVAAMLEYAASPSHVKEGERLYHWVKASKVKMEEGIEWYYKIPDNGNTGCCRFFKEEKQLKYLVYGDWESFRDFPKEKIFLMVPFMPYLYNQSTKQTLFEHSKATGFKQLTAG